MNTSKQVNVMIGLLFVAFAIFGAYMLNESTRQADAREEITEKVAERGARLFVSNCRSCHGLDGKGPEEGAVGPALNTPAFFVIDEDNRGHFGASEEQITPAGEAKAIDDFLFNTISCGRNGTFMPTWALTYGGSLSDTQVHQLVTLITEGRWDLVEEIGAEHDEETGDTAATIITSDPSQLSVTANRCGQFVGDELRSFRTRDPFAAAGAAPPPSATATATATVPIPSGGPSVTVQLGEWFVTPDPDAIEAGAITFDTQNVGGVAHELAIVRSDLAPDALPQAAGAVDEGAVELVGRVDQFPGGATKQQAFELPAGAYVLICNIPGHYGLGMYSGFTVR